MDKMITLLALGTGMTFVCLFMMNRKARGTILKFLVFVLFMLIIAIGIRVLSG